MCDVTEEGRTATALDAGLALRLAHAQKLVHNGSKRLDEASELLMELVVERWVHARARARAPAPPLAGVGARARSALRAVWRHTRAFSPAFFAAQRGALRRALPATGARLLCVRRLPAAHRRVEE